MTCTRSHPHDPDGFCDGSIHHLIVQLQARVAELEDVLRKVRTCASIDSSVMALVVESLNRKSLEQKAGEL